MGIGESQKNFKKHVFKITFRKKEGTGASVQPYVTVKYLSDFCEQKYFNGTISMVFCHNHQKQMQ